MGSLKESFYNLLGIAPGASERDVKRAYHAKAREHHPDRVMEEPTAVRRLSEEEIRKLNEAYEVLSRPETRELYDDCLERGVDFQEAAAASRPETPAERAAREANERHLQQAMTAAIARTSQTITGCWPQVEWHPAPERDEYFDALLVGGRGAHRFRVHVKLLPQLSPAHIHAIEPYAEAWLNLVAPGVIREHHSYLMIGRTMIDPGGVHAQIEVFNQRFWSQAGPRQPRAYQAWLDISEGYIRAPGATHPEPDLTRLPLELASLFR